MTKGTDNSDLVALRLGSLKGPFEAACAKLRLSRPDFLRAAVRDALEKVDPAFSREVLRRFLLIVQVIVITAGDDGLLEKESVKEFLYGLTPLREEIEGIKAPVKELPDSAESTKGFPPPATVEQTKWGHLVDDILEGVYRLEDFFTGGDLAESMADPDERQRQLRMAEKSQRRRDAKKAHQH